MQQYELVVLAPEGKSDEVLEQTKKLVNGLDGKVEKIVKWGEKPLAYPIKKQETASFFSLTVSLSPSNAAQIGEKLRLQETLLRYLLVKKKEIKTKGKVGKKVEETAKGEKSKTTKKVKAKTKRGKKPA